MTWDEGIQELCRQLQLRPPCPGCEFTQATPRFDQQLDHSHDLGSSPSIGDFLLQIVELNGKPLSLLAWGPACYVPKDRDLWMSWSAPQRIERLKLIVQNRRLLLLLPPKGSFPDLASMDMGAALRAWPSQWFDSFGYRPVLAENFTDPEAHHGTTYKATNWIELGTTAGYSRNRLDFYIPNECPKRLWCLELVPKARSILRSRDLPMECASALSCVPTVLPEQSGPRREEPGKLAPLDPGPPGRSRDPQPLAP